MPISQSRMVALIECTQAHAATIKFLRQCLESEQSMALSEGRVDIATALGRVLADLNTNMPSYVHIETLANESAHFRLRAKGNDAAKHRMRRLRGRDPDFDAPLLPEDL